MTRTPQIRTRILSPREREIVDGLVKGLRMVDLARIWAVSDKTVGTYRRRVLRKLGLRTNADLVLWAQERAGVV